MNRTARFVPAALAVLLIVSGCASTRATERGQLVLLDLETVSVEHRVRGDFTRATDVVKMPGDEFRDERLSVRWTYASTHLDVTISNLGEDPVNVRWYEMAFIDENGTPHRIFTGDLAKYEAGETVPPPPIEPGKTVTASVSPSDYVYWYGPLDRFGHGAWEQKPIFPDHTDGTAADLQRRLAEIPTMTIGMFLPVEIKGVIHDYRFMFKAVNVRPGPVVQGPGRQRFLGQFGPEH